MQGAGRPKARSLTRHTLRGYAPRVPMTKRRQKTWWALAVAGAILALTAMAGPDAVQHLWASAKDHHDCAVYHWTHGAGSSAPALGVLLSAPPLIAQSLPPESSPWTPKNVPLPPPSRAPPATA